MIPQAASVPFRRAGGGYEILLVTTKNGKWTLPKGIVDPGETRVQTAFKEAVEEAGVKGNVEGNVVGTFTYHKWGEKLEAQVFLLEVRETFGDFQESDFRSREWFAPKEALKKIRKRMRGVLREAVRVLDERFSAGAGRPEKAE